MLLSKTPPKSFVPRSDLFNVQPKRVRCCQRFISSERIENGSYRWKKKESKCLILNRQCVLCNVEKVKSRSKGEKKNKAIRDMCVFLYTMLCKIAYTSMPVACVLCCK